MVHTCTCTHTHTHTREYYSAIKKKKIMPLATTWTDLEIIILSEVKSERHIYLWNLKNYTNELIYKIEKDSDIENKPMFIKKERMRRDKLGVWD